MGVSLGREVGYAVRFEDRTGPGTRVAFMTDGALLARLSSDPLLSGVGAVILDEAHERSLATDVLFGLVKRLAAARPGFKVVAASATLDAAKFSAYLNDAPVINVPGRVHPVVCRHVDAPVARRELVAAAVGAALDAHAAHALPGDVLVFLPGAAEVDEAVQRIKSGIAALRAGAVAPAIVLPLYAALPPDAQAAAFAPPPPATRRIVVATTVAETSVTLDGVTVVVDGGVCKRRSFDAATGVNALAAADISRAQAVQRAGRAGRTAPGTCYRLYTEAALASFDEAAAPEIARAPLAATALRLLTMPTPVDVLTFDYLDPPPRAALEGALLDLHALGALDADGRPTPRGRRMAALPLDPPLARTLLDAAELGCLEGALSSAAALSADSLWAGGAPPPRAPASDPAAASDLVAATRHGTGDAVTAGAVLDLWCAGPRTKAWAAARGLDARGLRFAADVRKQLKAAVAKLGEGGGDVREVAAPFSPPTRSSTGPLRQAILIGHATRLARRLPRANGYRVVRGGALAEVHAGAAGLAAGPRSGLLPEWLAFSELASLSGRLFLVGVTEVDGACARMLLDAAAAGDAARLSRGGRRVAEEEAPASPPLPPPPPPPPASDARNDGDAVAAARARFLARKKARTGG
jgi:ATP-dependent RNA helicase DHX8/PRP22